VRGKSNAVIRVEVPKPPEQVVVNDGSVPESDMTNNVFKIEGDFPLRKKIKLDAYPKCASMQHEPSLTEDVVADKDGNVQWAFVYVKKGAEGKTGPEPAPAEINQTGCHYEPHVLGIMVGKDLTVKNSDDLLHNIHALPFDNKEFNFGQPQKGMTEKKQFSKPEVMVKVKCDVHPWMGAWIGVLDHPFYAVTDEAGKYEIKGLPDGKYTIEVWHEKYKSVSSDVEVKGASTANFELADKKE
jgi:plastocyanin